MAKFKKLFIISLILNIIFAICIFIEVKKDLELSKLVVSIEDVQYNKKDLLNHIQNSNSRYSVLDEIIQKELIRLEANAMGLNISEDEIQKERKNILNIDSELSNEDIKTRILAKKIMLKTLGVEKFKKNEYTVSTYEILNSNISYDNVMNLKSKDLKNSNDFKYLTKQVIKNGDIFDGHLIETLEFEKAYTYESEKTQKRCIMFVDDIKTTENVENTINSKYMTEYVKLISKLKSKYKICISI